MKQVIERFQTGKGYSRSSISRSGQDGLAWTAAHQQYDLQALDRLMAEEYVIIAVDGRVLDKGACLASDNSQTSSWEPSISDRHQVHVYSETAIIVARWTAKGANDGGSFEHCAYLRFAIRLKDLSPPE